MAGSPGNTTDRSQGRKEWTWESAAILQLPSTRGQGYIGVSALQYFPTPAEGESIRTLKKNWEDSIDDSQNEILELQAYLHDLEARKGELINNVDLTKGNDVCTYSQAWGLFVFRIL